jgi:hypothetical protein
MMGSQHLIGSDFGVIEEPISGLDFRPAPASRWNTVLGLAAQLIQQPSESLIQTPISQIGGLQFFRDPRLHREPPIPKEGIFFILPQSILKKLPPFPKPPKYSIFT